VDGDARLPVLPLRIENLALVGIKRPAGTERGDSFSFEVARDGVRRPGTEDSPLPIVERSGGG
jgi:hypothetical protein